MLRHLHLLLVIVFVEAAKNEAPNRVINDRQKRFLLYRPIYTNLNATGIYDPNTEKCCMGKISDLTLKYLERCCGEEVYDITRQLCCNGQVFRLEVDHACCGNTSYDTRTSICCGDKATEMEGGERNRYECCGNKAYKSDSQVCCYNGLETNVVDKKNPNATICCGDESYDYNTELCCSTYNNDGTIKSSKVIAKIEDASSCCGNEAYNYNTKGCCGEEIYNSKTHTCCYADGNSTVVPTRSGSSYCCGTSLKTYDYTTQICCGNKIYDKTDGQSYCCGNNTYNYETELCCYRDGDYTVSPYNRAKDEYSNGVCCNGRAYNNNEGTCCTSSDGSQRFHKQNSSLIFGCCGTSTYNYKSQLCCVENVYEMRESVTCCGNKLYNYNTHICCIDFSSVNQTGNIFENKDNSQACCGSTSFDARTEVCCGNRVFKLDGYKDECCFEHTTDENQCSIHPGYPRILYDKAAEATTEDIEID